MYIRFETSSGVGIFHQAMRVERTIGPGAVPLVARADRAELRDLMDWLWAQTPVPPRRVWADAARVRLRSWFRMDAAAHLERAWQLYALLVRSGSEIRPVTRRNPGAVVFEDAVQAVVRPYHACADDLPRHPWRRRCRDRATIRRWSGPDGRRRTA